jgi:hypothetical protein
LAGDWIKVEKATARKPEVLRIAGIMGIHPDHAFGLCIRFWCWCDDQLNTPNAHGVSDSLVDSLVERSGFASALLEVGWLQARNGSLAIPNFDRHLSQSAKQRALTARRVAKHTCKTKPKSANGVSVSSALPREESFSIGSITKDLPLSLRNKEFEERLAQWMNYKSGRKESYKPQGLAAMISRADKLATAHGVAKVIDAMERAMANGWQGWDQPTLFKEIATPPQQRQRIRLADDDN